MDSLPAIDYQNLVENATDLIQSVNPKGNFIYVNKAWSKTLGYNKTEAQKLHFSQIIHPDHLSSCQQIFNQLKSGLPQTNIHTTFINKQKKSVSVQGNITPVINNKKFIYSSGFFQNISTHHKIKQASILLSYIIEQNPLSTLITDRNGIITYANPSFTKLTGYHQKEVIGKNPNILKSGITPLKTYQELWQKISHNQPWFSEITNKKKNGQIYPAQVSIFPITTKTKEITNFVQFQTDLTKTQKIKQSLEKQVLLLERFKLATVDLTLEMKKLETKNHQNKKNTK